ncbi:MAG: hypothetical protein KAU47_06365, partial [Candidatus Aminicenantes bacterium]|nr:hypothetical protein [Candidatus Aminicenantes bacterium]
VHAEVFQSKPEQNKSGQGFGLKNFSMNPIFIPKIKKALRSVELKTVKKVVREAMNLRTAQEIEEFIIEKILVKHPNAFLTGKVI